MTHKPWVEPGLMTDTELSHYHRRDPALGRKPAQTIFVLVKVGMTNVLISPSLPSHQHAHDGNGARGQAFTHILSSFRMENEIIHGGCEESMANCVDCVES